MSAILEALRDKPLALFKTDSASPYSDYSGYGRSGTATGTPGKSAALTAGAAYSSVFTKGAIAKFECPSPVWKQGYEDRPFSLEAWAYPINRSENNKVQTYQENLADRPVPTGANDGEGSRWMLGGGYWGAESTKTLVVGTGPFGRSFLRKTIATNTHPTANGVFTLSANPDAATLGAPVTPGVKYYISFYLRSSVADFSTYLASKVTDEAGTVINPTDWVSTPVTVKQNNWTRITASFTVPAGATRASVRLNGHGAAVVGSTFDASALMVTTNGFQAYSDGATPGWEWSGTVNDSSSRARKDVARINLAPNPSVETNVNSVATYSGTNGVTTGARLTTGGVFGSSFYRMTWTTSATATGGGVYESIAVKPGVAYTFSAYLRSSRTQRMLCRVEWRDGNGGVLITNPAAPGVSLAANTWTRVSSVNAIAPAGATWATATFYNVDAASTVWAAGDTLDSDGFLFEESASLGDYFDGSSVGATWGTSDPSWSYMLPSEDEVQILGHTGAGDGIVINGTAVSFSTKYLTTGSCRVSYDLQVKRRFHVVGVHTAEKNSLYIDGVLVGETEPTDAQRLDKFPTNDGFLYSGSNGVSSKAVSLNAVGIYGTALSPDSIARHFAIGNKHLSKEAILKGFAGARIPLSQDEGDVFLETNWTTKTDWETATLTDVVVVNERLVPSFVGGVSIPGNWTDLFVMSATDATSIYGVNMVWDGEGAIIEASLDGVTWETAERGKNLAIIPPGFNPQQKELMIRISFPGGFLDDSSYVDNLTVTGFKTGITPPVHGRTVSYTAPAYIRNDHEPVEYSDDWGTRLKRGSVVIGPDTSDDPFNPGTIELWVKNNGTDRFYIDGRADGADVTNFYIQAGSANFAPTRATAYVNGNLRTTEFLNVGEWTLLHLVPTTPASSKIFINTANFGSQIDSTTGDITVGQVVLYENALTAAQVKDIYESYVSLNVIKAADSSFVQMTEQPVAAVIVDADWSIVTAG